MEGATGQCKNTTSWGRIVRRVGRTNTSGSLAQKLAQPCLDDVPKLLTVNVKRAGWKTAFPPEIALLLFDRPKNRRTPQMNSPAQLLEVDASWRSWSHCTLRAVRSQHS